MRRPKTVKPRKPRTVYGRVEDFPVQIPGVDFVPSTNGVKVHDVICGVCGRSRSLTENSIRKIMMGIGRNICKPCGSAKVYGRPALRCIGQLPKGLNLTDYIEVVCPMCKKPRTMQVRSYLTSHARSIDDMKCKSCAFKVQSWRKRDLKKKEPPTYNGCHPVMARRPTACRGIHHAPVGNGEWINQPCPNYDVCREYAASLDWPGLTSCLRNPVKEVVVVTSDELRGLWETSLGWSEYDPTWLAESEYS